MKSDTLIRKASSRLLILLIVAAMVSCNSKDTQKQPAHNQQEKETLLKINKKLIQTEDQRIEDFIARYRWKMTQTGSGLRYMIYNHTNGRQAKKGMIATINYTLVLLTGDTLYNSDLSGPKQFEIGKGGVESGLEEGILILKTGERAKFIIPSHLAFGLAGDPGKIPPKATLVYDIELIDLTNKITNEEN